MGKGRHLLVIKLYHLCKKEKGEKQQQARRLDFEEACVERSLTEPPDHGSVPQRLFSQAPFA